MAIQLSSIPPDLIRSCELLTGRLQLDAVLHVLSDYPRLIADLRKANALLHDFDNESKELDLIVDRLRLIAFAINEL
ncbi:hypothetical protein VQ643_01155 [Pseudomonas sp. F1_0610]|uniref:DASH complex subunit Dad3 n=1 Tax=Pseudomonas sp. F1_0610 TaxID=3114284 RepID=UPI0039C34480